LSERSPPSLIALLWLIQRAFNEQLIAG